MRGARRKMLEQVVRDAGIPTTKPIMRAAKRAYKNWRRYR